MDGRRVVWIDKQTFFALRVDQYAFDQPHHLILRTSVTAIRYNQPLNPALFRPTVPPGYRLVHGR
jgi:outer membrane lipoprotein-sorting protein